MKLFTFITLFSILNVSFYQASEVPVIMKEKIHSEFFSTDTLTFKENQTAIVQLKGNFSSILVKSIDHQKATLHIVTQYDSTLIEIGDFQDIETPQGFWIPSKYTDKLKITSEFAGTFVIHYFYATQIELPEMERFKKSSPCEQPNYIPAEYWRAGLPDPIPNRVATKVNHVIVHHSAGNNNDTNYINIVRNIYLLHTQSNGWDDIGYNFLIAPNGMVFGGRDPLGVADIDNIQGAHFCRKNSGTMGICLLGNYSLIEPSKIMISKLEDVITWKLNKENLKTDESFLHPDNSGSLLSTIAMHQDGCNTACPGEYVKNIFSKIKDSVAVKLATCDPFVSIEPIVELKKQLYKIYPNPTQGRFFVMLEQKDVNTKYTIKDNFGRIVEENLLPSNGYIKTDLPTGFYYIYIENEGYEPIVHKLVVNRD